MSDATGSTRLRLVTFHNLPLAYRLTAGWAERMGHEIALVVTTPGPSTRRTVGYREIAASAPPQHEVLVTTRLRRVAAPLIAALKPDLIVAASFPYRLPPEVLGLPRLGAINLHPTPLPAYRGPNALRLFYDGAPTMGATVHRMDEHFDTGPILSRHTAPVPDPFTAEAAFAALGPLMVGALTEGAARAIAGDPGQPQESAGESYSPEFTPEECWLDWNLPKAVLQRRAAALNFFHPAARATINGQPYAIHGIEALPAPATSAAPGTVLDEDGDSMVIAVADGEVRVAAVPLAE